MLSVAQCASKTHSDCVSVTETLFGAQSSMLADAMALLCAMLYSTCREMIPGDMLNDATSFAEAIED